MADISYISEFSNLFPNNIRLNAEFLKSDDLKRREEFNEKFVSSILPTDRVLLNDDDGRKLTLLNKAKNSQDWRKWWNQNIAPLLKEKNKESDIDTLWNMYLKPMTSRKAGPPWNQSKYRLEDGELDSKYYFTSQELKDFSNNQFFKDLEGSIQYSPGESRGEILGNSILDIIKIVKETSGLSKKEVVNAVNTYIDLVGSNPTSKKPGEIVNITTDDKDKIPELELISYFDKLPKNTGESDFNEILNTYPQIAKSFVSKHGADSKQLSNTFIDLIDKKQLSTGIDMKGEGNDQKAYRMNLNSDNDNNIFKRVKAIDKAGIDPIRFLAQYLLGIDIGIEDIKGEPVDFKLNNSVFDDPKPYTPDFQADVNEFETGLKSIVGKEKKFDTRSFVEDNIWGKIDRDTQRDNIYVSNQVLKAIEDNNINRLQDYFEYKGGKLKIRRADKSRNKNLDKATLGLRWEHTIPMKVLGELIGDLYNKKSPTQTTREFYNQVLKLIKKLYTVTWIPTSDDDNLRALGLSSKLDLDDLNMGSIIDKVMKDGELSDSDNTELERYIFNRMKAIGVDVTKITDPRLSNFTIPYPVPSKQQQNESLHNELRLLF